MARSARMQQRPRNPYSSAEIDRASHERENDERMIELAASGEARFVPIDSEKNLVSKARRASSGTRPEATLPPGQAPCSGSLRTASDPGGSSAK